MRRPSRWLTAVVLVVIGASARAQSGPSSDAASALLGPEARQAIVDQLATEVQAFASLPVDRRNADLLQSALNLYAEKLGVPGADFERLTPAQRVDAQILVGRALARTHPPDPSPPPAPPPPQPRPPAPPQPPAPRVLVVPVVYYYVVPTAYVPVVPVRKHRLFH